MMNFQKILFYFPCCLVWFNRIYMFNSESSTYLKLILLSITLVKVVSINTLNYNNNNTFKMLRKKATFLYFDEGVTLPTKWIIDFESY